MTARVWDVILVGAGLANGLIAWRLTSERPDLRILVLEQAATMGGNHTWSFHDSDLSSAQRAWIAPLVTHHWPGYEVRFPALTRALAGGYSSIASTDFARVINAALGDQLRLGCAVAAVTPTSVTLASGDVLHAGAVIDGRGVRASASVALGYQTFLGQEVRLAAPHGLTAPIIMDATVAQGGGYRFVYVLPFGPDTLLIEDTHYVDQGHIDPDHLRANIAAYAQAHRWDVVELLREERGSLPITLAGDFDAYWQELAGQPCSGLRAGLFHPTTGYSLPHALRLAERIAALPDLAAPALFAAIRAEAQREWRSQGFFRLLNRMLFLAGRADQRWSVMQRFYHLRAPLIARFYAGALNPLDKLRLVSGKPPVPVMEAMAAARKTHPKHLHLSGHAHEQP
ncbi:lycopene beta-cyclase CrtY [Massilia sp. S19_KUP03_FR1]|uniref:lycopene beta-cyclase CrtY n=1 Tax=Massilia sp. S19_KUP03_FR1 TaxID=3025503 RepID=UPI002FCD487A